MNSRKLMITLHSALFHRNVLLALLTAVIVLGAAFITSSISASGRSNAAGQDVSYKYYRSIEIEEGDSLWRIAEKYMTDDYRNIQEYVAEIKELNGLGDDEIHSGQYLTIPYYSSELK